MHPVETPALPPDTERARDRRARALFEAIDDAVFVHDLDGRILDANPAACRRLGYTRDELLTLTTRDIDDPEFAAGYAQRVEAQVAAGRLTCEGRHVTKDGRLIPVEINTSVVQIDGRTAVLAVVRDVTARKVAERRQAAQYAVTRALAESATLAEAAPRLLRAICEGLEWDFGALWFVDRQLGALRCADTWHRPGLDLGELATLTREATFPPGAGIPGRAWDEGRPVWVGDIPADASPRKLAARRRGLHAALAVPVLAGGETAGVLEFFHRALDRPDGDLRSMLAALGSQVGQFLERKRVEEALRESEAFYHSLVESLPQNILRKDLEGRFTFANQRSCALIGKPLDQVVGRTDFDLFPAELAAKYRADDRKVLEAGATLETVEEHRTPTGELLYVQIVKTPIYDRDGAMIGTQVIFWDVTERKRWEEALRESERRYRQLTEASQDAIIVANHDGRITLFNPAAERAFGYAASEILGQSMSVLIPEEDQERHQRGLARSVSTHQPHVIGHPVELHGRRKDGSEFPLELVLSAIDLGGELQFLWAIRDMTERNRMRSALVQSDKLASIGLLCAGVAHEINNPLAYVANNLVVLERDVKALMGLLDVYESARGKLTQVDPGSADRARALAEEMDLEYLRNNLGRIFTRTAEGVQRVKRIVQSLRSLARTAPPKMEVVSLPDLVDMSLEMIHGRMQQRGIQVELDYGATKVWCVPTQLSQVLLNLLVNALQAVEAAGRVEGGKIRVASRLVGDELVVEVADNGCGIAPHDLPRLFDPFFTTKPVGEGTGLGLSITHSIVTGHGGRVEVDSRPNDGSCFRIILPAQPPEVE